jgi:hypothetical protein
MESASVEMNRIGTAGVAIVLNQNRRRRKINGISRKSAAENRALWKDFGLRRVVERVYFPVAK